MKINEDCHFCKIANDYPPAHIIYECADLVAFLSFDPIRESHALIVTKEHYNYFDDLPKSISHKIVDLGQRIARAQKEIYPVERAGFLYTGGDIAHVHAHVVPLFEKSDITSLKYINREGEPEKMTSDGMKELEKITKGLKSKLETV